MISKKIIQISKIYQPQYIIDSLKLNYPNYEYINFNDDLIEEYIKNNSIEGFENALEIFQNIKNGAHKADFFRYYYLYLNGGIYLDSDAMLLTNFEDIMKDKSLVTVISCLNNNSIFNGFIACCPKHPIIFQILEFIYKIDKDELDKHYFDICIKFKKIIDSFDNKTILLLEERRKNTKDDIYYIDSYYEDKALIRHYYSKKKAVESLVSIEKKNNKKKIIGITLNIPSHFGNIFSNGLNQNSIYLGELLINIGFEVYFIINDKVKDITILEKLFYENNFKYIYIENIFKIDFDVIFFISFSHHLILNLTLRYNGTKCVYYDCGNIYLCDGEKILYNKGNGVNNYSKDFSGFYDLIMVIPQMVNTNLYYLQTLYRTKAIEVPFVWSPKAINYACKAQNIENEDELLWTSRDYNKIAIFEPNLSLMKWCVPALLIAENSYRIEKNIDHVYLNNTVNHGNIIKPELEKIVKSLDLYEDNKITCENRFNTLMFMKNYANIAVSFQMENPLNYLYFDLVWMGYPLIHNAHLIKDLGYYYEGFNYEEGGLLLNDVIKNHNFKSYIEKNRKLMDRFLVTNKELQLHYKKLIFELLNT